LVKKMVSDVISERYMWAVANAIRVEQQESSIKSQKGTFS